MTKSKSKELVNIYTRPIANGGYSVALHYYDNNGTRQRKNTHLFLVPETDKASKEANKQTMKAVEAMKAQLTIELANGKAGIKPTATRGKMLLVDWMKLYKEKKAKTGQSKSNAVTINNLMLHLEAYKGNKVMIKQVDKAFCEGFIMYLATCKCIGSEEPKQGEHKPKSMAKTTATLYYNTFVSAMNEAERAEVIDGNPCNKVDKDIKKVIKPEGRTRTYLTTDEIKALMNAKCPNEEIKRAFFFACFCGLRISDIRKLTWGEVIQVEDKMFIKTQMTKTRKEIIVPIGKEALTWMSERGKANDLVFPNLPTQSTINDDMKTWAKRTNITKDIVFHTSRHTFGTNLITKGVSLYATSQLMGHQDTRVTQVYAEIADQVKIDAINKLDGIFD